MRKGLKPVAVGQRRVDSDGGREDYYGPSDTMLE